MPELEALVDEAERQFTICNACRYCEDYCPVFPAMERRSLFDEGDLGYIANLCHDCRACHQACMYTEPHDFAINIPALMAEARVASYQRYTRPRWFARAFESGPRALTLLTLASIAVLTAIYALLGDVGALASKHDALYDVVGHLAMAVPALLLSAYAIVVLALGLRSFWKDAGAAPRDLLSPALWSTALREIAAHRWMRGGGGECYFPEEDRPSPRRRRAHAAVLYGFTATFAATVWAFVQETVFASHPPYPLLSGPVLLGLLGGIAVVAGGLGLLALNARDETRLSTGRSRTLGRSFLLALLAVAVTGLALLVVRSTSAIGIVLIVHLATIAVLYVTAPYGKLVHAVYRTGAVLHSVAERRAPAG